MEEQNKIPDSNPQNASNKEKIASPNPNKKFFIVVGAALLLIAIVWVWKTIEIGSIKKQAVQDRQELKQKAEQQIVQANETHMRLLAKPYVWAIRAEMIQGNISQVNLFASDMVKEKNFQLIAVANDKGIIVSSTNKKNEGQPFSVLGTDAALNSNETNIENVGDSVLVMTSPVMGFNNRIGTLLIKYAIQKPEL